MSWNICLKYFYFFLLILFLFSMLPPFLYLTKYVHWRSLAFNYIFLLTWIRLSLTQYGVKDGCFTNHLSIIGYLNQYEKGKLRVWFPVEINGVFIQHIRYYKGRFDYCWTLLSYHRSAFPLDLNAVRIRIWWLSQW